uniref:Uncharacterized protein n=1 Tax=Oryza sativa subsp. japonica TaxID=39947 RepID=Q7EY23_ORYSJ|nr:hypothetical protein [Oryza sativa Japonica Group]
MASVLEGLDGVVHIGAQINVLTSACPPIWPPPLLLSFTTTWISQWASMCGLDTKDVNELDGSHATARLGRRDRSISVRHADG